MKNREKNILKIIIILSLIISIVLLARFAYAKYIAQIDGQATAQIAEMKFKINEYYYESTEQISFSSYRDDSNPKIAKGMLAPGTYGHVPITIDATETQTSLEYEIIIDLINKPTNLKFYSDKAKTEEILVKNDKIIRRGYISINEEDTNKKKYETLYWEWPTEIGENRYEINENDIDDSRFMDKIMEMQVNVRGTQIKENPVYLGDSVEIGKMVNFTLKNGTTSQGIVVNTTPNQVDIMPIDNNTGKAVTTSEEIALKGIDGYNKAVSEINKAAIKGYSGATRALTIEDLNNLTGFNPDTQTLNKNVTYTSSAHGNRTFIVDKSTMVNGTMKATSLEGVAAGDLISIGDEIGGIHIDSITIKCTDGKSTNAWYRYYSGEKASPSDYLNESCWLASTCINAYNIYECNYSIRRFFVEANNTRVDSYAAYSIVTGDYSFKPKHPVVPIISLSANEHLKDEVDNILYVTED